MERSSTGAGEGELPVIELRATRSRRVWPDRVEDIEFGTCFTPNMFIMRYAGGRWQDARIQPVANLSLHPGSTVFHYAQETFEGLKAFLQKSGRIAMFRPGMNAARLNESARRLQMPAVPVELFLDACRRLVEVERDQVPPSPGSLYLRPTMIGTDPYVKVSPSKEFLFYILTLSSGPYFRGTTGRDPGSVCVLVSESVSRTGWGGMGLVKAGANYAGTLNITAKARERGCHQVLFLEARETALAERKVEEMGGMNVFFVDQGALVTPPLRGTILPGVTRDSIVALARLDGIPVREEPVPFGWVMEGIESGRITEAMACGTAAVVTGIGSFHLESGRVMQMPRTPGPVTQHLFDRIRAIQYGDVDDPYDWVVPVCEPEAAVALGAPVL